MYVRILSCRGVVRRQKVLQYKVEKYEGQLFNKADEKECLQKKVIDMSCDTFVVLILYNALNFCVAQNTYKD